MTHTERVSDLFCPEFRIIPIQFPYQWDVDWLLGGKVCVSDTRKYPLDRVADLAQVLVCKQEILPGIIEISEVRSKHSKSLVE